MPAVHQREGMGVTLELKIKKLLETLPWRSSALKKKKSNFPNETS